ncbi:MAG: multicopper oxidase family protein [Burkholderiales bacterium]
MRPGRRAFLAGSAALACAPLLQARADVRGIRQGREVELVAAPATLNVVGAQYPDTAVWAFNRSLPGPLIEAVQGETLRVRLRNRLPEETTVHWHGIRLPNAMDGVPHLTQPPVPPGGEFVYEFALPDAGTYWYHPHANSSGQLGRGLYGALVVKARDDVLADHDQVLVLSDFRMDREARIDTRFAHPHDRSHDGRVGNTVMVNGRVGGSLAALPGQRWRLRLVNAANARIFRLRFEGHEPVVVALDGHAVEPHREPAGIVLGPGMRADVLLDMSGSPGSRHRILDDWYRGRAYHLLDIDYRDAPSQGGAGGEPPRAPRANPLAEPDLGRAERLQLVLGGGAMSPALMRAAPEERRALAERMRAGGLWTINEHSHLGHAHAPLYTLAHGRSYVFEVLNDTAWHHPLHIHGIAFRVLSEPRRPWRDTVLLAPGARAELAFVADNPGDWMIHCHILEHQESGMMASMRIQ